MATPSDTIDRHASASNIPKGFIEVPVAYSHSTINALVNITTIARIEPYYNPNDEESLQHQTFVRLTSRNAQGKTEVLIVEMPYAGVKSLLAAAL